MKERVEIDILKGIGILLVVFGHTAFGKASGWIYLFHMPLFFFISGLLFKKHKPPGRYLGKKCVHLLVPYFTYLLLLNSELILGLASNLFKRCLNRLSPEEFSEKLEFYSNYFASQFYGGTELTGNLSVFWFVTCLFITQQVFNLTLAISHKVAGGVTLMFFVLSTANQYTLRIHLPWWMEVVGFSMMVFYIGPKWGELLTSHRVVLVVSFVLAIVFSGIFFSTNWLSLDVRQSNFGIPILSLVIAVSLILSLFRLSRIISQNVTTKGLGIALAYLGKASMTIMFAHQVVKHAFWQKLDLTNPILVTVLVTLITTAIHFLISQNRFLSLFFSGSPLKSTSSNSRLDLPASGRNGKL